MDREVNRITALVYGYVSFIGRRAMFLQARDVTELKRLFMERTLGASKPSSSYISSARMVDWQLVYNTLKSSVVE